MIVGAPHHSAYSTTSFRILDLVIQHTRHRSRKHTEARGRRSKPLGVACAACLERLAGVFASRGASTSRCPLGIYSLMKPFSSTFPVKYPIPKPTRHSTQHALQGSKWTSCRVICSSDRQITRCDVPQEAQIAAHVEYRVGTDR